MFDWLISPAYAQSAGGTGGGDLFSSFLPIILIMVVFYFLLIRPQQKKVKDHKAMCEAVKRGDQILSQGGILGKVTKVVSDTEVEVEIAEGVKVKMLKQSVADVLNKTGSSQSAAQQGGGGLLGSLFGGGKKAASQGDTKEEASKDKADAKKDG